MTRMSREFSLVLLGAGILTAGYFFWPEDNLEAKGNQEAVQQVAGNNGHRYTHSHFIFLHMGSSYASSAGPAAKASISRGGFGVTGRGFSGGA